MFEISKNQSSNYVNIVLARSFVTCENLSFEEFKSLIKIDMDEAIKSYKYNSIPKQYQIAKERYFKNMNDRKEKIIADEMKYAEKKWKTEKRRNKHMEEVMKRFEELPNDFRTYIYGLEYFDFDGNCGTENYINASCIIKKDSDDEALENCFSVLKESKYFDKAIGWEFIYEGDAETYRSCFRPSVKLLFDIATEKEIHKSKESLSNAIDDFYKNTNYYGD